MQRVPVDSSSIASIGYAPEQQVLELEFRESREVYQYFDVPAAESPPFSQPVPRAPISISTSSLDSTVINESRPRRNSFYNNAV
jgi:hypothetical protein